MTIVVVVMMVVVVVIVVVVIVMVTVSMVQSRTTFLSLVGYLLSDLLFLLVVTSDEGCKSSPSAWFYVAAVNDVIVHFTNQCFAVQF